MCKNALLGCSLCTPLYADDPETWLRIREIQRVTFGCCSLTTALSFAAVASLRHSRIMQIADYCFDEE